MARVERDNLAIGRFGRFLPDIVGNPALSDGEPLTRRAVTMFADIAGFTSVSERLARFGTAGTEQVGDIVRRAIGGALDVVAEWGGDALAFGGDAITVEFQGKSARDDAQSAAAEIVTLFKSVSGTDTLAGPVELSVRVGISSGQVTSMLCEGKSRHVLVHLGAGLDRAADTSGAATRNGVLIDPVGYDLIADGVRAIPVGNKASRSPVPEWAAHTVHPLTASRISRGVEPPDEHRWVSSVFVSIPPVDDSDPVALKTLGTFVAMATDLITQVGGEIVQCSGGTRGSCSTPSSVFRWRTQTTLCARSKL